TGECKIFVCSVRVVEGSYHMSFEVPQTNDPFEEKPDSALLIPFALCPESIKSHGWNSPIGRKRSVHEVVAIIWQPCPCSHSVDQVYESVEHSLPKISFFA